MMVNLLLVENPLDDDGVNVDGFRMDTRTLPMTCDV